MPGFKNCPPNSNEIIHLSSSLVTKGGFLDKSRLNDSSVIISILNGTSNGPKQMHVSFCGFPFFLSKQTGQDVVVGAYVHI